MKCLSCGKYFLDKFEACPFCGAEKESQEVAPTVEIPVTPVEPEPKPAAEQVATSESERQSPAALWEAASRNDAQGVVEALWPEVLAQMPIDHQGKVGYLVGRFPEMSGDLIEEVAAILQSAQALVEAISAATDQAPTPASAGPSGDDLWKTAISGVSPEPAPQRTSGDDLWATALGSAQVPPEPPAPARPLGQDALASLRGWLGKVHINLGAAQWGARLSNRVHSIKAAAVWRGYKTFSERAADSQTSFLAGVLAFGALVAAILLARILVIPVFLSLGIGILVFGRRGGFSKREITFGVLFFGLAFVWLFFGQPLEAVVKFAATSLRVPPFVALGLALLLAVALLVVNRLKKSKAEVALSVTLAMVLALFLVGLLVPTKTVVPSVSVPKAEPATARFLAFGLGITSLLVGIVSRRHRRKVSAVAVAAGLVLVLLGVFFTLAASFNDRTRTLTPTPTKPAATATPTATVTATLNVTATTTSRVQTTMNASSTATSTNTTAVTPTPTGTPTGVATATPTKKSEVAPTATAKPAEPTKPAPVQPVGKTRVVITGLPAAELACLRLVFMRGGEIVGTFEGGVRGDNVVSVKADTVRLEGSADGGCPWGGYTWADAHGDTRQVRDGTVTFPFRAKATPMIDRGRPS